MGLEMWRGRHTAADLGFLIRIGIPGFRVAGGVVHLIIQVKWTVTSSAQKQSLDQSAAGEPLEGARRQRGGPHLFVYS